MAMTARRWLAVVVLGSALARSVGTASGQTQAELNAAASNAADWLLPNHDYGGQRFVTATEITRENAKTLGPVCLYQAGSLFPFHTNPIVYRGVLYLTTPMSTIALDAATCRVRWRHDWTPRAKENWRQNRGVALKDGKVIRGTDRKSTRLNSSH